MLIKWKLELTCSVCHADITMEGTDKDKPKWRIDGKIAKQLSDARKFVLNNHTTYYSGTLPSFVESNSEWAEKIAQMFNVAIPDTHMWVTSGIEFHYINCPSCDGRAYRNSKVNPPREME